MDLVKQSVAIMAISLSLGSCVADLPADVERVRSVGLEAAGTWFEAAEPGIPSISSSGWFDSGQRTVRQDHHDQVRMADPV